MTGIWLGIDTTSKTGGVALLRDGELIAESILPVMAFHSEKLLPAVSRLLDSSGISGCEMAGIGVSAGPGSYTGLRIGAATAMGLSAGWKVPMKGVSSLRVLAASVPHGRPVLSCIRARQGEVFAGVFQSPDPLSVEMVASGIYSTGELLELLNGDYTAVGSGRREMIRCEKMNLHWAPEILDHPRPAIAALCASADAAAHGFDKNIDPLYLREFNQRTGSHAGD